MRAEHGPVDAEGGLVRELDGEWVGGVAQERVVDQLVVAHAVEQDLHVVGGRCCEEEKGRERVVVC